MPDVRLFDLGEIGLFMGWRTNLRLIGLQSLLEDMALESQDESADVSGLKIYLFVSKLLENGATPAEIEHQIVQKGIDPREAAELVRRLGAYQTKKDIQTRAAHLLDQGATPHAVASELVQAGYEPETVKMLVQLLIAERAKEKRESRWDETFVLRVMGIILILAGGLLVFGNRTGMFPTFPYLGTVLFGIGILLVLMGEYRRS